MTSYSQRNKENNDSRLLIRKNKTKQNKTKKQNQKKLQQEQQQKKPQAKHKTVEWHV